MYAANTYVIRPATHDDAAALHRLAELDSASPLAGPVLIGEMRGAPVAALAVDDGRTIADPFVPTAHLLATLRTRAEGLRAVERTPALRARILAALVTRPRAAHGTA
jgi:hypothetical protein